MNEKLNKKERVLVRYVDFSKAFDTKNSCTVAEKFCNKSCVINRFQSFLRKRSYVVKSNDLTTNGHETKAGAQQRSVLGLMQRNDKYTELTTENKNPLYLADDALLIAFRKAFDEKEPIRRPNLAITEIRKRQNTVHQSPKN